METTLGGDESTDHIVGEKAEKDEEVYEEEEEENEIIKAEIA